MPPEFSGEIKKPRYLIQGLLKEKYPLLHKKIFFHPDYTVGAGISPVQFEPWLFKTWGNKVAGYTAGRE